MAQNAYAMHWSWAHLRKSFGKTEIIRGAELAVQAGERWPSLAPTAPASPRCST